MTTNTQAQAQAQAQELWASLDGALNAYVVLVERPGMRRVDCTLCSQIIGGQGSAGHRGGCPVPDMATLSDSLGDWLTAHPEGASS